MTEFAIFTDDELLEAGFYTREAAEHILATAYTPEDNARVVTLCPKHRDYEANGCAACADEDEQRHA